MTLGVSINKHAVQMLKLIVYLLCSCIETEDMLIRLAFLRENLMYILANNVKKGVIYLDSSDVTQLVVLIILLCLSAFFSSAETAMCR